MHGIVKFFNPEKGWGFIGANGKDYFVHFKSIQILGYKKLEEGQHVTFVPAKGDRGDIATEVVPIQDDSMNVMQ